MQWQYHGDLAKTGWKDISFWRLSDDRCGLWAGLYCRLLCLANRRVSTVTLHVPGPLRARSTCRIHFQSRIWYCRSDQFHVRRSRWFCLWSHLDWLARVDLWRPVLLGDLSPPFLKE